MWSYALFFKNTYQRGEHTRKSFTLSVWAGLTDVCWTPWVICFLQFLSRSFTLILSLTLSPFRLILAMCELWHLPTWEQLEKKLKPPFSDAVIYRHKRWKNCKTAFAQHVMSSIDVMKIEWRCQWLSSRFNLVIFHWICSWYYILKQFYWCSLRHTSFSIFFVLKAGIWRNLLL